MGSGKHSAQSTPDAGRLQALYPDTGIVPLTGLYLCHDLRAQVPTHGTYVYTNFITSLDGRIALENPDTGQLGVPKRTANTRDWRLLLELAAPADALIISGRYLRQLAQGNAQAWPPFSGETPPDLMAFRDERGLARQPALVIVTRSVDVAPQALARLADRRLIVATVDAAPARAVTALRDAGAEVLFLGSDSVEGGLLARSLGEREIRLVYSIAGPAVLHMLLEGRLLQRIYLTTVLRVLAGNAYATLARGAVLDPPYDFKLIALYLDRYGPDGIEQLLQVYDRVAVKDKRG